MTERIIAQRLGIGLPQVQGTVRLLREGATIPFISRYRKEATGSLDELQVGAIKEQLDRLTELEARRQTVLTTIEGQGKLTGELRKRIEECWNAVELEDIYLPYKPKRRTRATAARERGWNRWPTSSWHNGHTTFCIRRNASSRPRYRPPKRPLQEPATSSPRGYPRTNRPATPCGARWDAKGRCTRSS